jgi:iron complex outermembrane receptor protein
MIKELNWGTTSDENGIFEFKDVPLGHYNFEVSYLGYKSHVSKITVEKNQTTKLNIQLEATALVGKELVVVANRAKEGRSPAAFNSLEKQELNTRYYAQDVPVLLSELPSTKFYSESGNGIGYNYLSIRGFGQRRISVMINGIPQNDPEDHNVYWIDFPDFLENVEDIQVQRGAGSAFLGPPAIGGSINIRTSRFSAEPRLNVYAGYGGYSDNSRLGGYNTSKLSISCNSGLINDKFIFTGRISQIKSDGYREKSWVDYKSYFLGLAYFTKRSSLRMHFYGGPIEDHLAYYGISKEMTKNRNTRQYNPLQSDKDIENFNQPHLEIIHQFQLKENLTLNNSLFGIRGYGFFDYDGSWAPFSYFRLTPEYGFDVNGNPDTLYASFVLIRANVDNKQIGWLPNLTWEHSRGNLIFGSEFRLHHSLHWGRIQEGSSDLPVAVSGEYRGHDYIGDRHYYEYKGSKDIISPFISSTFYIDKRTNLDASMQFLFQKYRLYDEAFIGNDFTVNYFFLNPRVGINHKFSSKISTFISYSHTTREPRLKSYYDAAEASTLLIWGAPVVPQFEQNPDGSLNFSKPLVHPEELNDFELGFGYTTRILRATLNLFYMDFRDEIIKSGQLDRFGQPITGNADRTIHTGIELFAQSKLGPHFDLIGNLTYSHNELVDYTEYRDEEAISLNGNPIAGFPDLIGNLRLNYRYKNLIISLSMQIAGKQYTDNFGDQSQYDSVNEENFVDPYAVFNSVIEYDLSRLSSLPELTAQLHIRNFFDTLYNTHGEGYEFFPAAERHFFFNIKMGL